MVVGMAPFFVSLLLLTAATIRITRLLVEDRLTQAWRMWVLNKYGAGTLTAYLFWCPWCLSVWVGAVAAVPLVWLTPAPGINVVVQYVGAVSLMSLAAGVFSALTYEEE